MLLISQITNHYMLLLDAASPVALLFIGVIFLVIFVVPVVLAGFIIRAIIKKSKEKKAAQEAALTENENFDDADH